MMQFCFSPVWKVSPAGNLAPFLAALQTKQMIKLMLLMLHVVTHAFVLFCCFS